MAAPGGTPGWRPRTQQSCATSDLNGCLDMDYCRPERVEQLVFTFEECLGLYTDYVRALIMTNGRPVSV